MAVSKIWGLSLAGLITVIGGVALFRNRRLFLVRDVTTGLSLDYPDLRNHIYRATIESVAEVAEKAINLLPRWRLIFHDHKEHVLVAEIEAPIGGFISELTITLSQLGENHIRTVIRSSSAAGRGDLGENARYIKQAQLEMDRLLIGA